MTEEMLSVWMLLLGREVSLRMSGWMFQLEWHRDEGAFEAPSVIGTILKKNQFVVKVTSHQPGPCR